MGNFRIGHTEPEQVGVYLGSIVGNTRSDVPGELLRAPARLAVAGEDQGCHPKACTRQRQREGSPKISWPYDRDARLRWHGARIAEAASGLRCPASAQRKNNP